MGPVEEKSRTLLSYPTVERWVRRFRPRTRDVYLRSMLRFTDYIGKKGPDGLKPDPESFLAWCKTKDPVEVQDVIEKYGDSRNGDGMRVQEQANLRSFLRRNGFVSLPRSNLSTVLKNWHRGYKTEEVQSLLGYLDNKVQKFYVMLAKDSGLRAQDLLSLKYRHVKPDFEKGLEYCHLYLEPEYYNRKKAAGITFIGPNSVKLLKELVEEGRVSKKPESPLVPFSYDGISWAIRLARQKAGLDSLIQPSHGLRKFFENCLDRVAMDHNKKLQLEGHSQGTRLHYTDRSIEELRELYTLAYPFLDLSQNGSGNGRVKTIEEANRVLQEGNVKLREDFTALMKRFDEVSSEFARLKSDLNAGKKH